MSDYRVQQHQNAGRGPSFRKKARAIFKTHSSMTNSTNSATRYPPCLAITPRALRGPPRSSEVPAEQNLYSWDSSSMWSRMLPPSPSFSQPAKESTRQPKGAGYKHRGGLQVTAIKRENDWTRERVEERRQKACDRYHGTQRIQAICLGLTVNIRESQHSNSRDLFFSSPLLFVLRLKGILWSEKYT